MFRFLSICQPFLCFLAVITIGQGEELSIRNNCGRTIYVKNEGANHGPFSLNHGQNRTLISINRGRSSRVWAHAGCNSNGHNCDTTEGYVSLAEMFWDNRGMTWYDVSHVDGYTLPIRMEPYNPGAGRNCHATSCRFDIGRDCPQRSRIIRDKRSCPRVYSWSKDDRDGMKACNPGNNGLRIIFC